MFQSHIVEVGGTFVGAAIATTGGVRFRAVHIKVEELDESIWRSLDELNGAVAHLFTTGRLSATNASSIPHPVQSAPGPALLASATGAASWMG